MKNNSIIIVPGEEKSIFFEILFKSFKYKKFKSPLILISSKKILQVEMRKNNFKKRIKSINIENLKKERMDNRFINLIEIDNKDFKSKDSINEKNNFLAKSFEIAFNILKLKLSYKLINGPINKSNFLNKKYLGVTEYISKQFNINKFAMLIYNKELSVCPLTTHLPIKLVAQNITQKNIKEKTRLINNFFLKKLGYKPKIGVVGLNPHCESILKFNEDTKIISPAIKILKKNGFKIDGPFPADTIFLKQNRKKYNVILGMYHDQVLSPIKSLKEYDAINITLGLPFLRVSPDHGPNKKMINKNLSNPLSLIKAINFLDSQ